MSKLSKLRTSALAIALAMPGLLFADEPANKKSKRISSNDRSPSAVTIDFRELGWDAYQPLWQPDFNDVDPESFDFQDKSALDKLTKLRSLSLVTFAQTSNTRLFLGINDDGMVGLHFSAFPKYGHDRHLSLWSMPYVDDEPTDDDSDNLVLTDPSKEESESD